MSNSGSEDGPPEPFSAFAYDARPDPGTLSLSDSDPSLSDGAEVASLSPDEEDGEEEVGRDVEQKPPVVPFYLKGTNANFSQRSNDIFGGLKVVDTLASSTQGRSRTKRPAPISPPHEKSVETPSLPTLAELPDTVCTQDLDLTDKGKISSTANIPVPATRLPDYLAHPERWTKYSLEDVPESNDSTNRNTALSLLSELQKRKESKEPPIDTSSLSYNQDPSSCGVGRILFNKPLKECRGSTGKRGQQQSLLLSPEELGGEIQEESETSAEQGKAGSLGFHAVKKRSRKNIRGKVEPIDEEETP